MDEKTLLKKFEKQSQKLDIVNRENEELRFLIENQQNNDEKFKALFAAIPIPISIIRKVDSEILFANNHFSELMGFQGKELVGRKNLNLFYDLSDRKFIRKTLMEKGFIKSFEFRAKTSSGKIVWLVTSSQPTRFHGEEAYIAGFYDISQRKQAENAQIEMNKSLDKKVKERTIALKRLNEHIVNSEENERKAIAMDLHDSVTQTIGLCISKIKNFKDSDPLSDLDTILQIQGHLEQANREIRSIIYQLSPPVLDDFDIAVAIGFLIEESNENLNAKIRYINNIDKPVSLARTNKLTMYRAVSELITNIFKHSGSLEAQIELTEIKNNIQVSVEDKGKGFDIDSIHEDNYGGFGLYSLSERLINMGGQLIVSSTIGKGTKVIVSVPVI